MFSLDYLDRGRGPGQSYTKVSSVCSRMFPEFWRHPQWPGPGRRTWSRSHQRRMPRWKRPPGCPPLGPLCLARQKTPLTAQGTATPICCPFQRKCFSSWVLGSFVLATQNLRVSLEIKVETSGSQNELKRIFWNTLQKTHKPKKTVKESLVFLRVFGFSCSVCVRTSRSLSPLCELNFCGPGSCSSVCCLQSQEPLFSSVIQRPPLSWAENLQGEATPCTIAVLWLDEMFSETLRTMRVI